METVSNGGGQEPSRNGISADFFTGTTESGLDRIRARLLDLTNRNKLLNFRHSNVSTLRVVNVAAEAIFIRLRNGEKLAFLAVPEPAPGDPRNAKEIADELGWNTSYDLDEDSEEQASALPVVLFPEALDGVSRKIASAAKTAIEESGVNMLYLVFGFLEWYESDDSSQSRLAPLVVLPVTMERTGGKGRAVEAVIEYSGEDIDTNLSLAEKMRRDFGVEIPLLEEEDTPESYLAKFAPILERKKSWHVRRYVTLALLSFGKLLMYRDLDPKTWPAGNAIAAHPIVRELFEGSQSSEVTLAREFDIDEPELRPHVPDLIRDADSSQHSALIHALRGQNLVIEGPPGTGKSQTITNLIAAAIARGKTVLFVSEKLAALEVVRKRLDEAGLGPFCLELHSHKTKKGALLGDIAQRIAMRGTFRDPAQLDLHRAVVEDKKQRLTQYADAINAKIAPFDATVFEILWGRERLGADIARHRDGLSQLYLPMAAQMTRTDYAQAEQSIELFARHLQVVINVAGGLDRHPWTWMARPLTFEQEEQALGLLEEFRKIVSNADASCDYLRDNCGIDLDRSIAGLQQAQRIGGLLPESGSALTSHLLAPCQDPRIRERLADFVAKTEICRDGHARLRESCADVGLLLAEENGQSLAAATQFLRASGLDSLSVKGIQSLLTLARRTEGRLKEANTAFQALLSLVGCDAPATLPCVGYVLEAVRILEHAPMDRLHLRSPLFEEERSRPLFETARRQAAELQEREDSLTRDFDLASQDGRLSASDLLRNAAIIDQSGLWQRWFGRDYKQAVRNYRLLAVNRPKASRATMSRSFRLIAEHVQKRRSFEQDSACKQTFGAQFQGLQTPWEDMGVLFLWYEESFAALPSHHPHAEPFRQLLFTARTDRLKSIRSQLGAVYPYRQSARTAKEAMGELQSALPAKGALDFSGSIDETAQGLQVLCRDLEDVLSAAAQAGIDESVTFSEIPKLLAIARQCGEAQQEIEGQRDLSSVLADSYRGIHTDIEPIRHTVAFARSLASGGLPEATVNWLLSPEIESRTENLRRHLRHAADLSPALTHNVAALDALSSAQGFWSSASMNSWYTLDQWAAYALGQPEELSRWSHFLRLQARVRDEKLDRLTRLAEEGTLDPEELVRAFRFVFHNTLARNVFNRFPILSESTGLTQNHLREEFARADKEAIRLYSQRVGAQLDLRDPPYGNKKGPVKTWTDLALLEHETHKQKGHIPIRQLIQRSAGALIALKPCFMMGPMSVAQYLAPGQLRFDLVVMDEASQLKPEDAIGALARGGQVVIVGDSKQLPPTNFFQRVSLDAEEDTSNPDRAAVEEGESILDVAASLFQPVRRLRWHYRSRHHSLIAFSNQEFYDGDLIIFPSALHNDDSLGVKHRAVAEGVFENGRNAPEAEIVVDAVLEHMRQRPHESLGVVTLNLEQRELLEELLDRRLREDPSAIAYQERMSGSQEGFFIKNLENVQGDERDVIFISTTYGPDARGNQYQRFGPINGPTGHRRLNVLFTRAKKRIVVFSSLDPDRIQTNPGSPWGVRALKQYLTYARTGIMQQAHAGNDPPANDFELSVGSVLKERGYEVVPQVGVAGFFIDLGVRHPLKPGAFLLGIECDGASYHSGRSARDRDRLRQEILENLGWRIHRVWSTDWFRSRDAEIKRLITSVEALSSQG